VARQVVKKEGREREKDRCDCDPTMFLGRLKKGGKKIGKEKRGSSAGGGK